MKTKIKSYWILIALVVIANIGIFSFFSRKLESLVVDYSTTIDLRTGL